MTGLDDALSTLAPLADMMATERLPPHLREDAVQEALIKAWQALEKGKPPGVVRFAMREAVVNVGRGRSMTGSKRKPGINGVDVHQRYGTPLTAVHEDGEEYLVVEPQTESAEDVYLAWEAVRARLAS